jgi:SAM-dependent methyltransferase
MYKMSWVQQLIQQTQRHLQQNSVWLGLDPQKPQRVLDYACGHGTVSIALHPLHSLATFHGLDIATSQVDRFNTEAIKLLGKEKQKRNMFAIQGDLTSPVPELKETEWFDFDIAIISMALHHVVDPILLLIRLRERVRKGGVIVVVDWVKIDSDEGEDRKEKRYDEAKMKKLQHGPKIWPGFSKNEIEANLRAAGCEGIETKVFLVDIERSKLMWGHDKLFITKAVVI